MKVYVVYGNDTGDHTNEFNVYGVFTNVEKAVDYAIDRAVKAFNKFDVPAQDRWCNTRCGGGDCDYDNDSEFVFGIFDQECYGVQIFVLEKELED